MEFSASPVPLDTYDFPAMVRIMDPKRRTVSLKLPNCSLEFRFYANCKSMRIVSVVDGTKRLERIYCSLVLKNTIVGATIVVYAFPNERSLENVEIVEVIAAVAQDVAMIFYTMKQMQKKDDEGFTIRPHMLCSLLNVDNGCPLSRKVPNFPQKTTFTPAYIKALKQDDAMHKSTHAKEIVMDGVDVDVERRDFRVVATDLKWSSRCNCSPSSVEVWPANKQSAVQMEHEQDQRTEATKSIDGASKGRQLQSSNDWAVSLTKRFDVPRERRYMSIVVGREEGCESSQAKHDAEGMLESAGCESAVDVSSPTPMKLLAVQTAAVEKNVEPFSICQGGCVPITGSVRNKRFPATRKRRGAYSRNKTSVATCARNKRMRKVESMDDALICSRERKRRNDFIEGDVQCPKKGLANVGNTCYMNAVLQSLLNVPNLQAYLLDANERLAIAHHEDAPLTRALLNLIRECSSLAGNVDRLMLKEVVSAVDHGRFSQGLQEDACEFLLELLKQLEDEHRRAFEVVKNDGDYEHLRDEVTNIFVFELEHTIICYRCGEERRQTENDCLLPLPLPPFSRGKRNRESVQSLIMRCLRSERVEHICSICHSETAIVQHSFTKLPKCLIVVLKRYEYNVQLANTSKRTDEGNQKVKYCSMEALLHMERDQSTTNVRTQSHHAMKSDSGSEGKQELVTVVDGNSNDFFMNLSFDTMALHSDEPLSSVSISKIAFTLPSAMFCRRARSICNLRCAQFSDWSAFRMSRRTCKYMHLDSRPALTARVRGDGNCLFRAISFLLTEGDEDQHLAVRAKVVEFEKEHFNYFEQFSIGSDSNFAEHVAAMSAPGKWGTAVELFAVATLLTSDVWTFYGGKWLVYRPRFRVQPDGSMLENVVGSDTTRRCTPLFLLNEGHHFSPVLDVSLEDVAKEFQLVSVVVHKGSSVNNGHYVCNVWDEKERLWLHCDDDLIEEIREQEVLSVSSRNAYLLFYATI